MKLWQEPQQQSSQYLMNWGSRDEQVVVVRWIEDCLGLPVKLI